MQNRSNMLGAISTISHENRGRVLLLFLLFSLAIYEFITAGFQTFTIVCLSPLLVLFIYAAFKWKMLSFWTLIIVNYFLQFYLFPMPPVPMSLPNEMLQIILLAIAIIDTRQNPHFERAANPMLFALILWCGYCTLEVLNDTCDIGIDISAWYSGARMMAFQLLYIYLVFVIYISSPKILMRYLKVWAYLSLFSALWTWKQQYIGLSPEENAFLYGPGQNTHLLQAGTLIRYWSTFSDAANYGCNAAASSVAFIVFGITSKFKIDRWIYIIIGALVITSMFASGTRTAIFCLFAGIAVFIVLSKNIKIAVPSAIAALIFLFILAFTNIGQGNQQIRRMRSAFDKKDASTNLRSINQATMRKYMKDAPWGIGVGNGYENVPANNKYRKMATIPPDSEYVYIWLRTGKYGITTFLISTAIMFIGACWIVFFRLKSPSLIGIGAGLCGAFTAIQLGAYGNQVLTQFPNGLIFYGGLAIVYTLPHIETAWIEYEQRRLAIEAERKRLKLEKKLASRV